MKNIKIILLGLLLSTIAFGVDKAIKSSGDLILDGTNVVVGSGPIKADSISEKTTDSGVTVDGVLLKDGRTESATVKTDLINEKTTDNGISIDNLLVKDGSIDLPNTGYINNYSSNNVVVASGAYQTILSGFQQGGVWLVGCMVNDTADGAKHLYALVFMQGNGSVPVYSILSNDTFTISSTGTGSIRCYPNTGASTAINYFGLRLK